MGKLFVISAPSGTGKTSLIKSALEDERASSCKLGISCTTRSKRPQEIDGVSYFFISEKEFDRKVKNEEFLEHAEVFGNLYGTPRDWVLSTLEKKEDVILELDIQGALPVSYTHLTLPTIYSV